MNEKSRQNVPDQRIGEEEVDRIIAHFCTKQPEEKRAELSSALEEQRETFQTLQKRQHVNENRDQSRGR